MKIIMQGLNIKPGDSVLLTTSQDDLMTDAPEMIHHLKNKFPGVEFVIVGGIDNAVVMPGSDYTEIP